MRFLLIFLIIVGSCHFNSAILKCGKRKGKNRVNPLVFGGNVTQPGDWPWVGPIFVDGHFLCGSSLISNKHTLTAAHCMRTKSHQGNLQFPPHQLQVYFGRFNITDNSHETGSIKSNVSDIYIHPDWNINSDNFDADIAIILLQRFIEFSDKIIPICLPPQLDVTIEQKEDLMGVVVGYGRSENAPQHEVVPRKIEIPTVSQTKCFFMDDNLASLSSNRTFCAGLPGVAPCNGDSGGGFYTKPKSTYIIEGIVSTSLTEANRVCNPNKLVVFTHVSKHVEWIQKMTAKDDQKIIPWDPNQCDEDDTGYFTLMGPHAILPDRAYKAHLSTFGFCDNATVHVVMKSPGEESKVQKFMPDYKREEREISFEINNQSSINYHSLSVLVYQKGKCSKYETRLLPTAKKFSIFIQTSQPSYSPKERVEFRILVLDPETKPFKVSKLHVSIHDSKGNPIRDFYDVERLKFGVYENFLDLAEDVVIGQWTITVEIDDDKEHIVRKSFDINEGTIPDFNVHIMTDPQVIFDDAITFKLYAEYAEGRLVHGSVQINVNISNEIVAKSYSSKRLIIVEEPKEFLLRLPEIFQPNETKSMTTVDLEVKFKDSITSKESVKRNKIKIYGSELCKLNVKSAKYFRRSEPQKITVEITHENEIMRNLNEKNAVKAELFFQYGNGDIFHSSGSTVNDIVNGVATFIIEIPKNLNSLVIKFNYKGLKGGTKIEKIKNIGRNEEELKIKLKTRSLLIGKKIEIEISSKIQLSFVTCVVIGRLGIAFNQTFATNIYTEVHRIQFDANELMTPKADGIIYYESETTGLMMSQKFTLNFNEYGRNYLSIETTKSFVAPSTNTTLKLESRPDSFIGILAVSQTSALQNCKFDIIPEQVDKDLLKYQIISKNEESNFFLRSNLNEFQSTSCSDEELEFVMGRRENLRNDLEIALPKRSRSDFDDCLGEIINPIKPWIFSTFVLEKNIEEVTKKIPDKMAAWYISGFSINHEYGLALAQPQKLIAFKQFFIKMDLPFAIKVGEILEIEILVYNFLIEDRGLNVFIIMYNDDHQFEFMSDGESVTASQKKMVHAMYGTRSSQYFHIRALRAGTMSLRVKAVTNMASDELTKNLIVKRQGFNETQNHPVVINFGNASEHQEKISLSPPRGAMSKNLNLIVVGDLMAESVAILQQLKITPDIADVQRTKNFNELLYTYEYLFDTKRLGKKDFEMATNALSLTVQLLLKARTENGSFSLGRAWSQFDRPDEPLGNEFELTAEFLDIFLTLKKFVPFDDSIFIDTGKFLVSHQKKDGSFTDFVGHTAKVVEIFTKSEILREKFKKQLKLAVENLENLLPTMEIAMKVQVVYALALQGKHEEVKEIFTSIKSIYTSVGDTRDAVVERTIIFGSTKCIMAAIEVGDIDFALLAAKMILKFQKSKEKQSTYEIYYTQIAFAKLSTILASQRRNLNLHIESDKGFKKDLIINDWTSLVVQKFEIPVDTSVLNIFANGTGLAFINAKYEYETNEVQQTKYFELDVKEISSNVGEKINLSICVSRAQFSLNTIEGKHMYMYEKMANPIVLEIYLPSGYVYDLDSNLRGQSDFVTKVEAIDERSAVMVHLKNVTTSPLCLNTQAIKMQNVRNLMEEMVKVYDYVIQDMMTIKKYSLTQKNQCETYKN